MSMNRNKTIGSVAALALGSALLLGGAASAKPAGTSDSVMGVFEATGDTFAIDAFADHKGNHPSGTVYGQEGDLADGGIYTLERIVCVVVDGNRATVGTQILRTNIASTPAGTFQQYSFVDNAASGTADLVGGGWLGTTEPTCEIDHSDPPAGYAPISVGDVTVADN